MVLQDDVKAESWANNKDNLIDLRKRALKLLKDVLNKEREIQEPSYINQMYNWNLVKKLKSFFTFTFLLANS